MAPEPRARGHTCPVMKSPRKGCTGLWCWLHSIQAREAEEAAGGAGHAITRVQRQVPRVTKTLPAVDECRPPYGVSRQG